MALINTEIVYNLLKPYWVTPKICNLPKEFKGRIKMVYNCSLNDGISMLNFSEINRFESLLFKDGQKLDIPHVAHNRILKICGEDLKSITMYDKPTNQILTITDIYA